MTMSHDRYPENLILTVEVFANCGWKAALAAADKEGYSPMWEAFSAAARQAIDEGRQAHGKALWLLADACSMRFSPDSISVPFRPFWGVDGRRSLTPDTFLKADVAFFAQILDEIDDPWLKARLADLVWLVQSPREVKFALAAIDSYRSIPLDTETWVRDGDKCWQRAINLTRLLGARAIELLAEIEASIIDTLTSVTRQNGFLGYWLADLLQSNALGKDHSIRIATKLESLAREFEGEANFHRASEYFRSSTDWFETSGDSAKSVEMRVATAEGWVKEAIDKISSDQPSYMVAASFYERAIQTYRHIPRSQRAKHQVDERLVELQARLNDCGERSLDEMNVFSTPSVDISQIVEDARNSVKGKGTVEALKAFANLHSGANAKELRKSAIKNLHSYPLQALFPATIMGREGRVIAKRPGMSFDETPTDADEIRIRAEMVHNQILLMDIVVQGRIRPAQEILLLEHCLQEADFVDLARQSPIVPIGRELLFGKALFAGHDRDFGTALHLLVPQIEHMVRFHLKQAGVQTIHLDNNGIENEKALSSLMDLSQAEEIFGANLSFEIKALFCDSSGPNLRNELAHGLLDDGACYSSYAIYAWWFGLKLVFRAFWNTLRNDGDISE